jgi:BirA family biotin operon repressor/biotin-[acetyl-CoA-carboxylase] ligase
MDDSRKAPVSVPGVSNPFGAPVYYRKTVTSTMDEARLLAAEGAASGTVIAAGEQSRGRGRSGRPWQSAGGNLFFTILLRFGEPGPFSIPEALTLRTGLAVSLALEDFVPALRGSVLVKWPNDVMILRQAGERPAAGKAAGILTEAKGPLAFIGVGVNVGQREFPEELRAKAASIAIEAPGAVLEPALLLEHILVRLYDELMSGAALNVQAAGRRDWRERLLERLYMRGRRVRFIDGAADSGREVEGVLAGIGGGGELLIAVNGETMPFITGELAVYE